MSSLDLWSGALLAAAHPLASVNASLNAVALALLIAGWLMIRRGNARMHRNLMLAAFATSVLFLACYLYYHIVERRGESTPFTVTGAPRAVYFAILLTHIPLAALVPVLAVWSIWLAWRGRLAAHRRLVRWTLPIWLYVSVTGVLLYVMLYWLYPAA